MNRSVFNHSPRSRRESPRRNQRPPLLHAIAGVNPSLDAGRRARAGEVHHG